MSEQREHITMTRAELGRYVDQAFLNGSDAAYEVMADVIAEMRRKIANATPGEVDQ